MRLELLLHRQELPRSCLPACLRIVLHYHGLDHPETELAALCGTRSGGTTSLGAMRALESLGCDAVHLSGASLEDLAGYLAEDLPVIVFLLLDALGAGIHGSHAAVVGGLTDAEAMLINPATGTEDALAVTSFMDGWSAHGAEGI